MFPLWKRGLGGFSNIFPSEYPAARGGDYLFNTWGRAFSSISAGTPGTSKANKGEGIAQAQALNVIKPMPR